MDTLVGELQERGYELIETHISRVFLRGDDVYKIKRPVDFGFLDFTTLEKREQACRAELALNRRLAPDVYRGLCALVQRNGQPALVPEGELARRAIEQADVVEWAVHMRRLSDETRADVLLTRALFERADVERVAVLLARFHRETVADDNTASFGSPRLIGANVEENFTQTEASSGQFLDQGDRATLHSYQLEFLERNLALFEQRARDGAVRDGHGDLRLEHLYRQPDGSYVAIDCIEFNERFRYADVCADIAFLAMDMRHHGRADLAELLIAAYARERGDYELYALLDFYESYRAVVRAKVASIMAADSQLPEQARERARREARRYYVLALSAARRPVAPARLIVTFGLIASGKSTVADALADRLAVPLLSADLTRKELLGVLPTEPKLERPFEGAYAPAVSERVYALLFERAAYVLRSGRSVVLDATFRSRVQRQHARDLAKAVDVDVLFVECRCPRAQTFERLARRRTAASVSDGRAEIYDAFATAFEPADELTGDEHLVLDTAAPVATTLAAALSALGFEGDQRLR